MYGISYKRDGGTNHYLNVLSLINSISYYSDRTHLPLRFVDEAMNAGVDRVDAQRTVMISK